MSTTFFFIWESTLPIWAFLLVSLSTCNPTRVQYGFQHLKHVSAVCNSQLSDFLFQIDVVLRYDLGPAQRESFIREAKLLAGLQHEYIMKCFGVVILGSYADSVALVLTACFILFAMDNHSHL